MTANEGEQTSPIYIYRSLLTSHNSLEINKKIYFFKPSKTEKKEQRK